MISNPPTLADRLQAINARISAACEQAGRDRSEVKLVAVTKTLPAQTVMDGINAGLDCFGENYIQEAQIKISEISSSVSWHFIGHLQSNKSKFAVPLFDLIHSVDSLKLARSIDTQGRKINKLQRVLIQVNVSGEESKSGVSPGDTAALVKEVNNLENVELRGLMTMPPFFGQPEKARPYFAILRKIRDDLGSPLTELSMGMSGDFEVAISEGATMIRVGTDIFGPRNK